MIKHDKAIHGVRRYSKWFILLAGGQPSCVACPDDQKHLKNEKFCGDGCLFEERIALQRSKMIFCQHLSGVGRSRHMNWIELYPPKAKRNTRVQKTFVPAINSWIKSAIIDFEISNFTLFTSWPKEDDMQTRRFAFAMYANCHFSCRFIASSLVVIARQLQKYLAVKKSHVGEIDEIDCGR